MRRKLNSILTQLDRAATPPAQRIPASLSESHRSAYQTVLDEFRKSGVPDRLTEANIRWIEGAEAVQALTEDAIARSQSVQYVTRPTGKLLNLYQFAAKGGWVAYGCNVDGTEAGEVAYFKPINPRREFDNGKLKVIKYETPKGMSAPPIVPWVDDQTAESIFQRYKVTPNEGETFWQVVSRCNLPVAIAEGLKKALALIDRGIPAIAVRGIAQSFKKGTLILHDGIAHFATEGRKIYIVFDRDSKAKTQADVRKQILKLGRELELLGCKVSVPIWKPEQGKGVDDALVAKGDEAQEWFDTLITHAPDLKTYKRGERVSAALAMIAQLNSLTYPTERESEGEFLEALPELKQGAIHVIDASMGAGKTVRVGSDWVKEAISNGWRVLVLAPLNSLGQQTSNRWGLPHIHDFEARDQDCLWATVRHFGGIAMCPDSLHRLPDWLFDRPLLLVLDEGNQVVNHVCQGDTLKSRWSPILEKFAAIANHSIQTGAIVLAEDGIPDRAVNFVSSLAESSEVRVLKHRKKSEPWNCTFFDGHLSGYRKRLLDRIEEGTRVLFMTTSQREAKRLERVLTQTQPGRKVVRIDSETNQQGAFTQFFTDPNAWLEENRPDVLILSPSAKSGLSIECPVFDEVWAYFPTLPTDAHLQLLGRYRMPVARCVFIPPFITLDSEEALFSPRAIRRRFRLNQKALAGVYGIEELVTEDEGAETRARIESAVLEYLSIAKAVEGAQKSIARLALIQRLQAVGHIIQEEPLIKAPDISTLWKDIQEQIWQEEATQIANSTIEATHTPSWARDALNGLETSLETRIRAYKVLWRDEFPGVMFDDVAECYEALCKDYGRLRRGVILQAKAENLDAAKEADREAVQAVLRGDLRALHRLPKSYTRSLLIAQTGVLELLDGGTYCNADPRAIAVKEKALHFRREIAYWLRLTIDADQTPVAIVNKLLKKLGLEGVSLSRPGRRGEERDRLYQVDGTNNPVRVRLLEALRRKLSGSVSTVCNKENTLIQIMDTMPESPPDPGEGAASIPLSAEDLSDLRDLYRQAVTAGAVKEFKDSISDKAWEAIAA